MAARDWRQQVHRSLDGELTDAEARELEAEAARWPALQRELDGLAEVRALIGEAGASERLDPVASIAPERLDDGDDGPAGFTGATLAAAATILISFSIWMARPESDGSRPGPGPGGDMPLEAAIVLDESAEDSSLVISIPSTQKDVHVFWVYGTES